VTLDPDSLEVQTFSMSSTGSPGGFCCTGCVSGCGINPTAGGCESGDRQTYEYDCNGTIVPMDQGGAY
jgi:hypothetical protein